MSTPQPIAPRSAWTPLIKAFITDHGLRMDAAGTVAQRSLKRAVGDQIRRDLQRGYLPPIPETVHAPPAPCAPAKTVVVLGADGFAAGNMSMMHVGVSVAPSYIPGVAQANELNLTTIATSRSDDHWGGLDSTLAGGYYSCACDEIPADCIAQEFNQMVNSGVCETAEGSLHVDPTGCFDLVAARGIRGGRGKCACHVAAEHSQRLDLPQLRDGSTWGEAKKVLDEPFPFLTADIMRADSHTPPSGWDYALGPWKCDREGCVVAFASHDE